MWTATAIGLIASIACCSNVQAQAGLPGVPGADVAAAGAAAPTSNLWSFLFPSQEQCARLKECICNTAIGEFAKSAAKPLTAATGGLLFSKCGVPTAEDLAKLAAEGKLDSEVGAAAKIKKSEAEAQARREAVRYLGTVDCNYWPEAKDALKAALRSDPSECVRFEAALALGRGCCCQSKEIIDALKHSANGTKGDGAPAESSPRVRAAAADALAYCASVYVEEGEKEKKEKEGLNGVGPVTRNSHRGKGLFGALFAANPTNSHAPARAIDAVPVVTTTAPPVPTIPATPTAAPPLLRPRETPVNPIQPVAYTAPAPRVTVIEESVFVPEPATPAASRPQRGLLRYLTPGGSLPPAQPSSGHVFPPPPIQTMPPAAPPANRVTVIEEVVPPATAPQSQRSLLRYLMPGGSVPPARTPESMRPADGVRPADSVRASDLGPANRGFVVME